MNQNVLMNIVSDTILDQLPDQALQELANISAVGEARDNEVRTIFTKYGIDVNQVAKKVVQENQNA